MQNFKNTFWNTLVVIYSVFSICITVPLITFHSIGLFVHKTFFISQARSQRNFRFLISVLRKKYQKENSERQIAKDVKLQYLFEK